MPGPDTGRAMVHLEAGPDETRLSIVARNRLVAWIVTLSGAGAAMTTLFLAADGMRVSDPLTVLTMLGLTAAVLWLTRRLGWRRRRYDIVFRGDHFAVGRRRFTYSEVLSYGLSRDGGDAYDPVSMGIPRNYTVGPHIFIQLGARRLPVTVGMDEDQAREALDAFDRCFRAYYAGAPPPLP